MSKKSQTLFQKGNSTQSAKHLKLSGQRAMTVFNTNEITMTKSNHTLDIINDKLKGEHKVEKIT